ncbi:hypothetical protein PFISCL1PPCAC_23325, partial [Pristionchus fissidentatus]
FQVNHPDAEQRQRIAHATCLDYFPTYFVTAELRDNNDVVRCTVTAAFQCVDANAVLIYDKCIVFPEVSDKIKTVDTHSPDEGALPVIYSMKQAQFIAKQAVKKGLGKMWIGVTTDGRSPKGMLIHSKMFNLADVCHWDGEELKSEENVKAVHLFLRTRTDYEFGRWQGHFEKATEDAKWVF